MRDVEVQRQRRHRPPVFTTPHDGRVEHARSQPVRRECPVTGEPRDQQQYRHVRGRSKPGVAMHLLGSRKHAPLRRILALVTAQVADGCSRGGRRHDQTPEFAVGHHLRLEADRMQHEGAFFARRPRVRAIDLYRQFGPRYGRRWAAHGRDWLRSGPQGAVEEGQAHVHAVVDVRVGVVELLVVVRDARLFKGS